MRLQLSTNSDIHKILQIINDAKVYLKSQKIDQWQHGYPNKSQIERDIVNNESYVLTNDANQVIATSMFSIRPEPTYKFIDGKWKIKESEKYGVIHRGRPLEVETFDDDINKVPRSIRILLEATRAPLASKTMREFKKLLGSIYRAKPGIQVFGFNQVVPGEENPFFDVPRYIKNTFDKYNVPDYNPSKDAPLTQKELIDRRG